MTGQNVDVAARSHVPDTCGTITAACDENIERRVQSESIYAAQVAVVMANNLVRLEIPALDHLVLTT